MQHPIKYHQCDKLLLENQNILALCTGNTSTYGCLAVINLSSFAKDGIRRLFPIVLNNGC